MLHLRDCNTAGYGGAFIYTTVFKKSMEVLYTLQVYSAPSQEIQLLDLLVP